MTVEFDGRKLQIGDQVDVSHNIRHGAIKETIKKSLLVLTDDSVRIIDWGTLVESPSERKVTGVPEEAYPMYELYREDINNRRPALFGEGLIWRPKHESFGARIKRELFTPVPYRGRRSSSNR